MASHQRTHTRNPGPSASSTSPSTNGSQTILQTEPQPGPSNIPNATLRLRGVSPSHQTSSSASQRVQWADDVVDNEGMGKKSSKVCCIYHKPHEPGDSSSDSDSSSSSDGESEGEDLSRAQRAGGKGKGKGKGKGGRGRKDDGDGKADRKPSPNAYERVPKHSHRYEHKGKKEG